MRIARVNRSDRLATIGRGWIDPRPRTAILAVGDVTVLLVVVAAGLLEHGLNPLSRPVYVLVTAIPFLLGWLVVAPFLGAYARTWWRRPIAGVVALVPIWVVAAWVGAQIRATALFPGGAQTVFVLVMIGSGLVALVPWRLVATAGARCYRQQ